MKRRMKGKTKTPETPASTKPTPDTQRDVTLTAEGWRELTDEEQAALDAYQAEEDAREAARPPRPETPTAKLSRLFRETPEMKALLKLTDAVHDDLNRKGNRKIEVSVPIAFIEMLS